MNTVTVRKKTLIAAMALAAWAGAAGAQPMDVKAALAKDSERWSGVSTVTQSYKAAPAAWTILQDAAIPYTAAFPCQPAKTLLPMGNVTVPTFTCTANQRAYTLQVHHKPMSTPLQFQAFHAGMEFGLMESATRSGAQPEITPIRKLAYQNFTGRDVQVSNSKLAINARNLAAGDIQITMNVGGAKHGHADDETFFNSLKPR